ncbi:MAG TPA: SDR family oxidoreductase [Euzebyales bacterium]|nr:SDR family oxidoreductase [Euzebyales bacterium]
MDTGRHHGRVAVVTGAASGIGRATALRLAREGATVVGVDVNEEALADVHAVAAEAGAPVHLTTGDITRQGDVDHIVRDALGEHGRIDLLANVAGIMDSFLPAHEVDDDTWVRVMAVNTTGPLLLCRAVLPSMRERGGGSIVNVGSAASTRGGTAGVAYTASKHALLGITRSIAWVYAPERIRCNIVLPGGVETNIGSTSIPRGDFGIGRLAPIHGTAQRLAQPDEIATVISWLGSDEAANVNGAIVNADGGWAAG